MPTSIRDEEAQPGPNIATLDGGASNPDIAALIGINIKTRRAESGVTLRQLTEAAETHFTHIVRIERGQSKIPHLALVLKLTGSLKVRCGPHHGWRALGPDVAFLPGGRSPARAAHDARSLGANARRARQEAAIPAGAGPTEHP